MKISIALAQMNATVGQWDKNIQKIVDAAQQAYQAGANLLITPELALSGYLPEDLLLRPAFFAKVEQALQDLSQSLAIFPDLAVLVGHPWREGLANRPIDKTQPPEGIFNAASLIINGKVADRAYKMYLPNTEVFDEVRYFEKGEQPLLFNLHGVRVAAVICEDIWAPRMAHRVKSAGAELLCVLNASPFYLGKVVLREKMLTAQAKQAALPIVYVNMVGGQDEIVFDGASFSVNAAGEVMMRCAQFEELVAILPAQAHLLPCLSDEAQMYRALVLAVRDYVEKNGFSQVLLGLSGGIDSALVLAIAYDAVGSDRVQAVMMPSEFTSAMSIADARQMAENLAVSYLELPITDLFAAYQNTLLVAFQDQAADLTEENIQARIRGTLLMALSNKFGQIVLTTGNKSETAVGYCTLYGDTAGGFAVLKDVLKTWVYRLARYRNQSRDFAKQAVIPQRIIERAPSAELRANQTDQDSLPDYAVLDAIIQQYMEEDCTLEEVLARHDDVALVKRVLHLIKINEYKRRQMPIGPKVSKRAFGKDWRYPITSHFVE